MAESISVQELQGPFEQSNQTAENAENDISNHAADTALVTGLLPGNGAQLTEELNNSDEQATQTDGPEAVGKRTLGGSARGTLGKVVHAEIPGAVDTRDDGVNRVLEPLRNPIHGKSDKDDQANDCGLAAAFAIGAALGVISRWFIRHVDGCQGDGEPGSKCGSQESTDQGNKIDMAIFFADSDARLEHQGGKGYARDPGVEGKGRKQSKDEKDNASGPVLFVEVIDGGSDGPANVQNARDPNKLLGEDARDGDVAPGQDEGNDEAKGEKDDGVIIQRKIIGAAVDAVAT